LPKNWGYFSQFRETADTKQSQKIWRKFAQSKHPDPGPNSSTSGANPTNVSYNSSAVKIEGVVVALALYAVVNS
jgi:hypothetical protein